MMQLTEEQRTELERRGWKLEYRGKKHDRWKHPAYPVEVSIFTIGRPYVEGDLQQRRLGDWISALRAVLA